MPERVSVGGAPAGEYLQTNAGVVPSGPAAPRAPHAAPPQLSITAKLLPNAPVTKRFAEWLFFAAPIELCFALASAACFPRLPGPRGELTVAIVGFVHTLVLHGSHAFVFLGTGEAAAGRHHQHLPWLRSPSKQTLASSSSAIIAFVVPSAIRRLSGATRTATLWAVVAATVTPLPGCWQHYPRTQLCALCSK